jgi:DNA-binding MarR family transcriptional regulator
MRIQRTAPAVGSTIIPSETARDHGISFTARGILAYVLSLPNGSQETLKSLTEASSEGRERVSRALKELETAGYLKRLRVRGEGGRMTTLVSWSDVRENAAEEIKPQAAPDAGNPAVGSSAHNPLGGKDLTLPTNPQTAVTVESATEGREGGEISRSENLLAALGRDEPKLHLGARDIRALSPLVDEWFSLGADERRVTAVLTLGLPERINHPAGLLRKRLVEKMPMRPLEAPAAPPEAPRLRCPVCERIKAPHASAGLCEHCRAAAPAPAPAPVTSGSPSWRDLAREFGIGALPVAA